VAHSSEGALATAVHSCKSILYNWRKGITICDRYDGGGCSFGPSTISSGQAFLIEFISSFILAYVGFDSSLVKVTVAEVFPPTCTDLWHLG
jgi:hypothetical protein